MSEAEAPAKFVALKTATLDLSAACSRPTVSESELRKGMAELEGILDDMEDLWQYVNANKRDTYEREAEAIQQRALKYVKFINPKVTNVQEAIGGRIPCAEKMITRSQAKNLDLDNPNQGPARPPEEGKHNPNQGPARPLGEEDPGEGTSNGSNGPARAEDSRGDDNSNVTQGKSNDKIKTKLRKIGVKGRLVVQAKVATKVIHQIPPKVMNPTVR